MPFDVGPWEIVVLALVVLLLFGGKRFPEVARQLGRGARQAGREYRQVKKGFELDPAAGEEPERRDGARKTSAGS